MQKKYEGAESMTSLETLLTQMGTSLRHTEELLQDKTAIFNSFQSMVKFIKLSVCSHFFFRSAAIPQNNGLSSTKHKKSHSMHWG